MVNKQNDLKDSNDFAEVLIENQMQEFGATNSRPLPIERGGTGSATQAGARVNLGVAAENHKHTAEEVGASSSDHKHTAEEVGASPLEHTHNANEINEGIIPVSRGGTGKTALVGENSLRSDMGLGTETGAVTAATIGLESPTSEPRFNSTYMPWVTSELSDEDRDLNQLINPGFYRIVVAVDNAPMDLPVWNAGSGSAILQVMPIKNANLIQILYHANGQIWRRIKYNSAWIEWKRMDSGEPPVNNLTSTSTTAPLSANQGRVINESKANVNHMHSPEDLELPTPTSLSANNTYMPWLAATLPSTNLNQIVDPGFYRITVAVENAPDGLPDWNTSADSATLQVMPVSDTNLIQVLYHNNGQIWRRARRNSHWSEWIKLQQELIAGSNITITEGANGTQTISSADVELFYVVTALPDFGRLNRIYLIPKGDGTFEQWAWIEDEWVDVGALQTDLSNVALQDDLDRHIEDTTAHMQAPTSISEYDTYMPWLPTLPTTDLNQITNPGFYRITVAVDPGPPGLTIWNDGGGSATLQVMPVSETNVIQIMYHNNGQIWRRTRRNSTWDATWVRIDGADARNITVGVLSAEHGGTGETTLQATRNAMGLGNTTGVLPVANGGTGTTVITGNNSLRSDLGFGTGTGALPAENGGTGHTTLQATRNAMGLGNTTGVLPVANGGTGTNNLTTGQALIGNGNGAVSTRSITDNTSNTSPSYASNALITERTLHNALPRINNANVSRGTTIFAPTVSGNAGQVLSSDGSNVPTWIAANAHTHTAANVGAAPSNHSHTAEQVGASPSNHSHTATNVGAAPATHYHNASAIDDGRFTQDRMPSSTTPNRVLRVGTANANPTYGQVSLTTDVTGALPVGSGGTGVTSFNTNQMLISGTATAGAFQTHAGITFPSIAASPANATVVLSTAGRITAGSFNATSDARLKENVEEVDLAQVSNFIDSLQIKTFNFKHDGEDNKLGDKQIGVIAQEVAENNISDVQFADCNGSEYYSVSETKLIYPLITYCQQLEKRLKELESR